ncbi:hypothetical protein PP7435_CHR1-2478 [Komagataella phaffii CBS 7435]|uniref:Altered inheritance rate of mitochondria protein 29 n=2 Tax=Komagataella phaffii TaxID=460519 RepID=C4QX62_KOMPG|nr:uncharacterized protein PAS_chr1-4_0002 [Komagataella phaffii GS115]CAH2446638.1 Hypothetical protein BQ9382_C1-4045 [Komagataella phaffii CBS 7435]CAY67835.1 hypothetical protein PAS_chr1-4_0002 [Komagataella phaffii GS115]SCV11851.1 hypothetical protein PP7435_CHR1-2478 [Komagataella phaffii CBS 7435]
MDLDNVEEPLTSSARPVTDSILTIRIIKSFPYRNVKNYVLTHVDLTRTNAKQLLREMKLIIDQDITLKPFCNVNYDSLKVYTHAHGFKSMNLVINLDHDNDWLLNVSDESVSLYDCGVRNESEISLFNKEAYLKFKSNPTVEKW